MDRLELLAELSTYTTAFLEEEKFIPRFKSLLRNFPNAFERSLVSGHMTGSAWIVDQKGGSVLLVHHKKLNRWLQPGGHADGEEDILAVSTREAEEETGLSSLELFNPMIFDVDIHIIPSRKDDRIHFHNDIRFLFIADKNEDYVVSEESNELAWIPINRIQDFVGNSISIHRMATKTCSIFS